MAQPEPGPGVVPPGADDALLHGAAGEGADGASPRSFDPPNDQQAERQVIAEAQSGEDAGDDIPKTRLAPPPEDLSRDDAY